MIKSFDDILELKKLIGAKPVVTFYSGGLDSNHLLEFLVKNFDQKIYALYFDLGQPGEDCHTFSEIEDFENVTMIKKDIQHMILEEYLLPYIQYGTFYEGSHTLSSSLTRSAMAKVGSHFANEIKAGMILHSATKHQNSLRRYTKSFSRHLDASIAHGTPYAENSLTREEKREQLINQKFLENRRFSHDSNFFCHEFETGKFEDLTESYECGDQFYWVKRKTPPSEGKLILDIELTRGIVTKIQNRVLSLETFKELNTTIGECNFGSMMGFEENELGERVLELREAPLLKQIIEARDFSLQSELGHGDFIKLHQLRSTWTTLVCEGDWYGLERKLIEKQIEDLTKEVNLNIKMSLSNGMSTPVSLKKISWREQRKSA